MFASPVANLKVLAVLYNGGKAALNQPRMLGAVENGLGLRKWLESQGHEYIVTADKEGPQSEFHKQVTDADILITTPFHPGYLNRELLNKAKNLKLAVTAGVGSDHVDLDAANERKITVAEVTGSNVVSVAEHVVMTALNLVRNYTPSHEQIASGGWNVAEVAQDSYDIEGKVIGTLGAGRIGQRVLQRLQPFNPKELLYYDYQGLPSQVESQVGARRVTDLKEFLSQLDLLTINAPLHEGTYHLIDKEKLSWMKKGAWIVNTARGAITVDQDIADAVNSGHLAGYGGDVWSHQPAKPDHPWRTMKTPTGSGNAMTPHMSGTSLDAQARYAAGTKDIIDRWLKGQEQELANLIVENGEYATPSYGERKNKK